MPLSGLSKNERSWMMTLNIEAISPAVPTMASPMLVTAPSSPTWSVSSSPSSSWVDLPVIPRSQELSKEQIVENRRAKNRQYKKVHNNRKKVQKQAMQAEIDMKVESERGQMSSKEQSKRKRNARNRQYSKVVRDNQKEYTKAMEAKVAQIEKENAALRAEVERELFDNERLKEGLGFNTDDSVWV